MKYAVPVTGGVMSPHFGHCEQFVFFDVDEQNKIIGRELAASPEHQPCLFPAWLAKKGTSFVITGGIGAHAQELLKEQGIDLVLGAAESDPEKAVLSHLSGTLVTLENACNCGQKGHKGCAH
jgi:predicted Fe-Mo cluster-binding NifX family protein